jgi:hypothetical protein
MIINKKTLISSTLAGLALTSCGLAQPLLLASCDESSIKFPTSLKSCDQLPNLTEAQRVINDHEQFIKQLEKDNPRLLFVDIHKPPFCSNKAIIKIEYGGDTACEPIREAVGKTFFGVPYILING